MSLNATPKANRTHIALFGPTNAGKSNLLNAMIGQDISIVADLKGTTTDVVEKNIEFLPYGPVTFIDTGGLDDDSAIGDLRIAKTMQVINHTNIALYVVGANKFDKIIYGEFVERLSTKNIQHLLVFNKIDLVSQETIDELAKSYPKAAFVSAKESKNILNLKDKILSLLGEDETERIVSDLLPPKSHVVLVIPIDSEAPKGRIILPQMQLIRDCLDHNIMCHIGTEQELPELLSSLEKVDLVVTDSQAFKKVSELVPKNIKLTGFSVLLAHKKGNIYELANGLKAIDKLKDGSKILMSESCTHNFSHEDIGRVKIPNLLMKKTGKKLDFDFMMGKDFPNEEQLKQYDLIIHCGNCMLHKNILNNRIDFCKTNGISITNYGLVLAYLNDILDRSLEIFKIGENNE